MFRIVSIIILSFITIIKMYSQPLMIRDIQFTEEENGDSPYAEEIVSVEGLVTYIDKFGFIIADSAGGPWSGIYIFDKLHRPTTGEILMITGTVKEYIGLTEIIDLTEYENVGSGTFTPLIISISESKQEMYESVLVKVENIVISNDSSDSNWPAWEINDGNTSVKVGDRAPYRFNPRDGSNVHSVAGVVWYAFDDYFIMPRRDADIEGRPVFDYALKGTVITPEGPQPGYYVHIYNDEIVYVGESVPNTLIIDTKGIIFPGLIDVHNHPRFNSFPTLQFFDYPFDNRYQWRKCEEFTFWKEKLNIINVMVDEKNTGRISKWAEILELMAGCVAIQGNFNSKVYSNPGIIINNLDGFPLKIFSKIDISDMTANVVSTLKNKINNQAVKSVLIHLSEGTDSLSLAEFYQWKDDLGLLNNSTAIIHGIPYGKTEFDTMAYYGAKLIWSPMSDIRLYGQTTDIKAAKESGVMISLAPDWTVSGMYNILQELNFAYNLNKSVYDTIFTEKELFDMVTINAAKAVSIDEQYGIISKGHKASLCVIDGNQDSPYHSLINSHPKDVLLTIVDGTPRYGDKDLMSNLGFDGELFDIGGKEKVFNIATNNPLIPFSNETVADIQNFLSEAHNSLGPFEELYPDELQFLNFSLIEENGDNIPPFSALYPLIMPEKDSWLEEGKPEVMNYRWKDFWDNRALVSELLLRIEIVEKDNPDLVKQIIVDNYQNLPENSYFEFIPDFDANENLEYIIRFIITDKSGNQKIIYSYENSFHVIPNPNSKVDKELGITNVDIFPNPVTNTAIIIFTIPSPDYVKIIVFDCLGQEIEILKEGYFGAGNHNILFNSGSLAAGVYYFTLRTGGYTETVKMVVLR